MTGERWWAAKARSLTTRPLFSITVERHTEASIWVGGRRRARNTGYETYHPTFEEAAEAVAGRAQRKVEYARAALSRALKVQGDVWAEIRALREEHEAATGTTTHPEEDR